MMMLAWYGNAEAMADEYDYMMDEMAYINEMDAMESTYPTDEEMEKMAQALA